jgi:hypothetical protein
VNPSNRFPNLSFSRRKPHLLSWLLLISLLFSALPAAPLARGEVLADPTITPSDPQPSQFLDVPDTGSATVSGVIGEQTDPAATVGIGFTVTDAEDIPGDLQVAATSSDQTVVLDGNLVVSDDGADRTLTITPTDVGYAHITVTVTDTNDNTARYTINYAASAASVTETTRFHTGASDASAAIAIDANHMLVGNDEDQMLRLYDRQHSGLPLNRDDMSFDVTAQLTLTDTGGSGVREVDIEGSTADVDRIYWIGSHSNSSEGKLRENRYRLFATDLTRNGADTTLDFVGYYRGLRADLIKWDQANGDSLGLKDSAAKDVIPEACDFSGFNIEGLAWAPGSTTTAFVAFRAPLVPPDNRSMALIVPVTNTTSLVSGNPAAGPALFGDPIELDLGGRGIRSIERNADDEYLIVAGPANGEEPGGPCPNLKDFRLFTWTGKDPAVTGDPVDEPQELATDLTALHVDGSFESIVELPAPLPLDGAGPIQLLVDNGGAKWYNDGKSSKDLEANWQKFRSEWVTLESGSPPPPGGDQTVENTSDDGAGSLRQALADVAGGGTIVFDASLAGQTITLSSAALVIDKDVTIDATGAPGLSISGDDAHQVLSVAFGTTVEIRGVTIRQGNSDSYGGGIANAGDLTLKNTTVTENSAADSGGGIDNEGTLTLVDSALTNNTSGLFGGGISNDGGVVNLFNSTVSGNVAQGSNAGADGGGGIDQYSDGSMTIKYSTIANNRAPNVAGRDGVWVESGTLDIQSSIVASNGVDTNAANCSIDGGTLTPAGVNIADDDSCSSFSMENTDPKLDALADNDGPSPTHALLSGSPAIDAIPQGSADCGVSPFDQDQRGKLRPQGDGCDVGAFELGSTSTTGGRVFLPMIVRFAAVAVTPNTLVPAGAVWRYRDDNPDLDPAWRGLGFDDSAWRFGPAELGYGDDQVTEVRYAPDPPPPPDPNNKYITTYFRHSFTVDNPGAYQTLELQLLRDDGAVVYLNGEEVVRSNMPAGDITKSTLASAGVAGDDEKTFFPYSINPSRLRAGENVLAVEIHQVLPTSSDISFNLALTGETGAPSSGISFAVIGDYGLAGDGLAGDREGGVANLVKSWSPDFIITLGDNNYPAGQEATIVQNIDAYYGEFIDADFSQTRFFPSLGNHDWGQGTIVSIQCAGNVCTGPYLDHFDLPGNERYYDFVRGSVHFFVVDSDSHEPDGNTWDSTQGEWLKAGLASASEPWKIVYFHHAPYSSGVHQSFNPMKWPFAAWGASAVLAGHDHDYERLEKDGIPYIVNGLGGAVPRACTATENEATVKSECYSADNGAMRVEADACQMTFEFVTRGNVPEDTLTLTRNCSE